MPQPSARRPFWIPLLLFGALVLSAGCSADTDSERPYNVVLVTLDTSRADYFGCYADLPRQPIHPTAETPNFDALAAEGVRFNQGIATAAVTPVAHAAILTGLFNHQHGLRVMYADGGFRLPKDRPTIFTELKQRGWQTGAFHSAFPVSDFFGLGEGFDTYETIESEMQGGKGGAQWGVQEAQRTADKTTDLALSFLGNADGPYAMWIHYWDPHDSVEVPPGVSRPSYQIDMTGLPEDPEAQKAEINARFQRLSPAERERVLSQYFADSFVLYATELGYVDQQFGRLVNALKDRGDWERTIVIVVADHGEGLTDHGWNYHRVLYQEQIRVPYLLRVPGAQGGTDGRKIESLVRTVDLAPTVFDYLGIEAGFMNGRSLRPLIEQTGDDPRIAFAEQVNGYDFNAGPGLRAQRPQDMFVYCAVDDRWKLLYRPHDPSASELFDLDADPLEQVNVYAVDHPEAQRLRVVLARQRPWVSEPFPKLEGVSESEMASAQARIRANGYAQGEISTGEWSWACPVHVDEPNDCESCATCGEPPIPVGLDN